MGEIILSYFLQIGAVSVPSTGGSIMSYCQLDGPSYLGNIHLSFGATNLYGYNSPRVPATIRTYINGIQSSSCLPPFSIATSSALTTSDMTTSDMTTSQVTTNNPQDTTGAQVTTSFLQVTTAPITTSIAIQLTSGNKNVATTATPIVTTQSMSGNSQSVTIYFP